MKNRQKRVKNKKIDFSKLLPKIGKEISKGYNKKGGNIRETLIDELTPPMELLDKDGNFTIQVSGHVGNIEELKKLVPNLKVEYVEEKDYENAVIRENFTFIGIPLEPITINTLGLERQIGVSLSSVDDN